MATSRDQLLDKRTVERNIEKNLLTKEEHKQYLATLADKANDADTVNIAPDETEGTEL